MNYNEIIDQLVKERKNQCLENIPDGHYRRVKWELYNPSKNMIQPAVGEEWDTEIVSYTTPLYTRNPFGHRSDDIYVAPSVPPTTPLPGILVEKINHRFSSQSELNQYVASIGATLIGSKDWYGADLSKKDLFKSSLEYNMYLAENTGGIWRRVGDPTIDARSMMELCPETNAFTSVSWTGLDNTDRMTKYLKFYENKECTYVGFNAILPIDTSIPGIPSAVPPSIGNVPWDSMKAMSLLAVPAATNFIDADKLIYPDFSISMCPVTVQFPYTSISKGVMDALGRSEIDVKFKFDMPFLCKATDPKLVYDMMYDKASCAMEEVGSACVGYAQAALLEAIKVFKKNIDSLFSIIGGAFSLIKSFLPDISFSGIAIDLYDLIFNSEPLQYIKNLIQNAIDSGVATASEIIDSIYSAIGSSYTYAKQKVQMISRDIVDAAADLYQYCLTMIQNGCVALAKLAVDFAHLWSIPPVLPNPIWIAIKAIKDMIASIPPLGDILFGMFPGFTAADLYQMVCDKINVVIDDVRSQIDAIKTTYDEIIAKTTDKLNEIRAHTTKFSQYLDGMWEDVTDKTTELYESTKAELESQYNDLKSQGSSLLNQMNSLKDSIIDSFKMGIDALKSLPIMSQVDKFLGFCGMALDDLMSIKDDVASAATTLYDKFVGGLRSIKDYCKVLVDQISTLAISKMTQWFNKLLGIFGLNIAFPAITIPVPVVKLKI